MKKKEMLKKYYIKLNKSVESFNKLKEKYFYLNEYDLKFNQYLEVAKELTTIEICYFMIIQIKRNFERFKDDICIFTKIHDSLVNSLYDLDKYRIRFDTRRCLPEMSKELKKSLNNLKSLRKEVLV